jgi:hypothetical protein
MPDSAREEFTLEELDAADLLSRILDPKDDFNLERLAAMSFICLGCPGKATPVAIKPDMQVSPHFRIPQHKLGCDVDGYEKLVKSRSRKQVSTPTGFPVPYPSKLHLPLEREVVNEFSAHQPPSYIPQDDLLDRSKRHQPDKFHHHTVTSIKRLVRHFVSFPHPFDRRLPLDVPGVRGNTYAQIFQRLSHEIEACFGEPKIYFGKLLYTGIRFGDDRICLPLTDGLWENQRPVKTIFLEINATSLSQARRKVLQTEVKVCINDRHEQQRKYPNKRPKVEVWLFFLGQQDPTNEFRFRLLQEDHRLVHCVVSNSLQEEPTIINQPSESTSVPVQKETVAELQPPKVISSSSIPEASSQMPPESVEESANPVPEAPQSPEVQASPTIVEAPNIEVRETKATSLPVPSSVHEETTIELQRPEVVPEASIPKPSSPTQDEAIEDLVNPIPEILQPPKVKASSLDIKTETKGTRTTRSFEPLTKPPSQLPRKNRRSKRGKRKRWVRQSVTLAKKLFSSIKRLIQLFQGR